VIVQGRQNGNRVCASIATAAFPILYEGTIAPDCRSMEGTYEGVDSEGTLYVGTWRAEVVPGA
jgi:hypothetical protein